MSIFAHSLERLREAARGEQPGLLVGQCRVLRKDLAALLREFERVEKMVDGEFVDLGLDGATKLVASTGVPEGVVVASDGSGKVHYVGPLASLPPFDGAIKRLVMNVHPNTLAAIGAAVENHNGPA